MAILKSCLSVRTPAKEITLAENLKILHTRLFSRVARWMMIQDFDDKNKNLKKKFDADEIRFFFCAFIYEVL